MAIPLPSTPATQRTPAEIAAAEAQLGMRLPEGFRRFVARHDGVSPPLNQFPVGPANASTVHAFVPLAELAARRRALRGRLPATWVPIASDPLGNFVCLDATGVVHFWDHETERVTPLAATFDAFLAQLVPFDPDSLRLDPDDILEVWVDPAFRAEPEEKGRDAAG
jgi:cell wall assembly regulator SMI1